jgi:hypothetical protein
MCLTLITYFQEIYTKLSDENNLFHFSCMVFKLGENNSMKKNYLFYIHWKMDKLQIIYK